jgi:hypothetical protein
MMELLKELGLIKQLDEHYETSPKSEADMGEFANRQNRRREIAEQIKALGQTQEKSP